MNDCTCWKCVSACKSWPGWFAPGEAEKAAEYLGVPFEEFKKNLIIDSASNWEVDNAPYVYSPRKIQELDNGKTHRNEPAQHMRGQCVFLKEDRCSIHAVKPYECKIVKACDFKHGYRDELEKMWIDAGAPLGMRPDFYERQFD